MEKYKSAYPTLKPVKVHPVGPAKLFFDLYRKDKARFLPGAKEKLAASRILSKLGEEAEGEHLYHVTHTKHVAKIQKQGILPMKTSNWVKAGNKERYGGGEVYTFTHKDDAHQWAGKMDWAHNKTLGSGKISIVTVRKPEGHEFEQDTNDPLSQAGQKGKWMKTRAAIHPKHIVSVEPYAPKRVTEAKDRIGTPTPSAEAIAKKHGKDVAEIEAQIAKGIKVEREHTKSDAEAHEIARDHLDEFPDYYDRLDKMEKKAKKDMKEGYDPDVEQIRSRIESHKKVAEKMSQAHGEHSQEAAFHRAYVKHMQKQLKDVHGLDEDAVPNSVGGGNIAGMPTHSTPDQTPVRRKPKVLKRSQFAGKVVFTVDEDTYYKAYLGKRKYEHYEKFLEGCEGFEEIRDFGRQYWDQPILIQNEKTGAMQFLKYGSK